MAGADLDSRPGEAALSTLDAGAWIVRCANRLMALNPDSQLDCTGWYDVVGELHESLQRLPPEWAAETYVGTR